MSENEAMFQRILQAKMAPKPPPARQIPAAKIVASKTKPNWPQRRSLFCDCERYDYKCRACNQKYRREWAAKKKLEKAQ